MPKDTLALVIQGYVSLAEFAGAIGHFSDLIKALSSEIAGKVEIEWEIANLEASSATAVVC